jgi:hypothetical protein
LLHELALAVDADPALAERPEFRAVLDGDRGALAELGFERVVMSVVALHRGLTPDEFDDRVRAFVDRYRHPVTGVHLRDRRYRPMLELVDELRGRGFDVFVVTGGGAEFVRVVSDDFYGVRPEGVVGTQIDYDVEQRPDGTVHLLRSDRMIGAGVNEGVTKPSNIQRVVGRRPCVAGGNSAGDAEMLRYAQGYDGPSLAVLVHHDDAEREEAYESEAATFESSESILDTAARLGWVVASMRDDWATVFERP